MRIAILIINFLKGIFILLIPVFMIHTMGEEPYSELFYVTIYILKCLFTLISVWVISDGIITFLKSFEEE
ncbi:hypothetical protein [Jeotgalibaca ciconiae]|uniref:Uncharacterized protein n=1 Tax=Jeotgalibaca ciconiae TaxID=2496265 RepID=A0A3Q9BKZ4_9LACT|nr:hypothetical protein [Jeotgalibaca ciconiae]AZP04313.1 hypothetical protein EJN90_06475 [Jeotgalibaca ciconiae]